MENYIYTGEKLINTIYKTQNPSCEKRTIGTKANTCKIGISISIGRDDMWWYTQENIWSLVQKHLLIQNMFDVSTTDKA